MFASGTRPSDLAKQTTLIILNEEMNYIMKIVKPLEESGLLIKGVSETIPNKEKYVIRYIRCQFIRKSINR